MKLLPVFLLMALLFTAGCTQVGNQGKPASKGRTGEVLVVSTEGKWNGPVGDTLRKTLSTFDPSLSQPEKIFNLVRIDNEDLVRMFRRQFLILIVNIKPDIAKSGIENMQDVWASPQRVIRINASSDSAFIRIFSRYKASIIDLFHQNEIRRFSEAFTALQNPKVEQALEQKLGIKMIIPSEYYLASVKNDFFWIRKETAEFSQGIMIYSTPFKDSTQLNPLNLKALRNSMTQINIPGPSPNSFMVIDDEVIPLYKRKTMINHLPVVEIRGLWKVQNDFMGGPFVNYTLIDQKHHRLISLDGFVYYPNQEKKVRIREIEAILQSITFPNQK